MKNTIWIVSILLSLSTMSCTFFLENRQAQNEAEARSVLVGTWQIKSFSIRANFYTQQIGIENDTALLDFGTIEFLDFTLDTTDRLTAPIELIHEDGTIYDGAIASLRAVGRDEIWIRTMTNRDSGDWDTTIGDFLETSSLFFDNYRVDFIDNDNIEITSEGVNTTDLMILERIR